MVATILLLILLAMAGISVLLFRVSHLLSLVKKPDKKIINDSQGLMFLIFMIIFIGGFWWYFFYAKADYLPESASEHGVAVDHLFGIVTTVILIPFTVLNILLFYAVFRFRYNKNRKAIFFPRNNYMEMVWTAVPAITLIILLALGLSEWSKIKSPAPKDAELIEIMGYQFAWAVRYPGKDGELGNRDFRLTDAVNLFGIDFKDKNAYDDFMPREIHVPKGRPVKLKIISRDVIHSVFAPHFRLKMDAVPGMPTYFWFTPRITTDEMRQKTNNPDFNYEIACAELCGRGHFSMRLIVVVDEPDDYKKWKMEQKSWASTHEEYVSNLTHSEKNIAGAVIH